MSPEQEYHQQLAQIAAKLAQSGALPIVVQYLQYRSDWLDHKVWSSKDWDSFCQHQGQREELYRLRDLVNKTSEIIQAAPPA